MRAHVFRQVRLWTIILGLLFLRIPLAGYIKVLYNDLAIWITAIYQVGSYCLIAYFIWLQRDHLADYHFDRLALALFLLFKPLYTILILPTSSELEISPLAFPHVPSLLFWLVSILLCLTIIKNKFILLELSPINWSWMMIGILFGLIWAAVVVFIMPSWITANDAYDIPLIFLLLRIPITLGSAAILEDPLFYGLLWGQLRKSGWKETWIWLTTAMVFTMAHGAIFYNSHKLSWLIFYFAGLLAFGWIVWRSRSITNSMMAHTVFNAGSVLIGVLAVGVFN